MASKIALSITSIPVSWKWEGVWMSMHGRLLSVAYALVPITFCCSVGNIVCSVGTQSHHWVPGIRGHGFWSTANHLCYIHSRAISSSWSDSPMASHLPKMEFTFLTWSFHVTLFFTHSALDTSFFLFSTTQDLNKHLLFFQPGMLIFKYHHQRNVFPDSHILDNQPLIHWMIYCFFLSHKCLELFYTFKQLTVYFMALYIGTKKLSITQVYQRHIPGV